MPHRRAHRLLYHWAPDAMPRRWPASRNCKQSFCGPNQKIQRSILRLNLVQKPRRRQLRNYFVLTALAIPRIFHLALRKSQRNLRNQRFRWRSVNWPNQPFNFYNIHFKQNSLTWIRKTKDLQLSRKYGRRNINYDTSTYMWNLEMSYRGWLSLLLEYAQFFSLLLVNCQICF